MKKIYTSILVFILISYTQEAFSWATDVRVNTTTPRGQTSLVASSDGTLYASVPEISLNPSFAMSIYQSTDNGASWLQMNTGGGSPGQVVLKSKLLVTADDTVLCMYQISTTIYTLNVNTGFVSSFNTINVQDFDAVCSPNGNAVYLFVDEASTSSLKRYTSTDGGRSWGGSTNLITSSGSTPRVYMAGTRLFLSYYGSLMSDVQLSKIVLAFYNESSPGTITAGTFQDIVTNTSVRKHQYQPVAVNGSVWFFWTEGTSPSVLKCRTSSSNGASYGTEFTIAGSSSTEVEVFDARHYGNSISSGVELAYYADSVQAGTADSLTERIEFSSADISNAEVFSSPQVLSDFTVDHSSANYNITLASYFYSFSPAAGVLWVEDDGNGSSLYFDATNSIVNTVKNLTRVDLTIYPNPAKDKVLIRLNKDISVKSKISILDAHGRTVLERKVSGPAYGEEQIILDVNSLSRGLYFIRFTDEDYSDCKAFLKM